MKIIKVKKSSIFRRIWYRLEKLIIWRGHYWVQFKRLLQLACLWIFKRELYKLIIEIEKAHKEAFMKFMREELNPLILFDKRKLK